MTDPRIAIVQEWYRGFSHGVPRLALAEEEAARLLDRLTPPPEKDERVERALEIIEPALANPADAPTRTELMRQLFAVLRFPYRPATAPEPFEGINREPAQTFAEAKPSKPTESRVREANGVPVTPDTRSAVEKLGSEAFVYCGSPLKRWSQISREEQVAWMYGAKYWHDKLRAAEHPDTIALRELREAVGDVATADRRFFLDDAARQLMGICWHESPDTSNSSGANAAKCAYMLAELLWNERESRRGRGGGRE